MNILNSLSIEIMIFSDPTSGVPISGCLTSTFTTNVPHNYNLLVFNHLFPDASIPINVKLNDKIAFGTRSIEHARYDKGKLLDRKRDRSLDSTGMNILCAFFCCLLLIRVHYSVVTKARPL